MTETSTPAPNPRRVAAGKRTLEARRRKRAEAAQHPANGNGQSPREEIYEGSDAAVEAAIQEDKRALSGNGRSTREDTATAIRPDLARAWDAAMATERARCDEMAAEFHALSEAKRALSNGEFPTSLGVLEAVRVVQTAIKLGKVELVAEGAEPAFYIVTRERVV